MYPRYTSKCRTKSVQVICSHPGVTAVGVEYLRIFDSPHIKWRRARSLAQKLPNSAAPRHEICLPKRQKVTPSRSPAILTLRTHHTKSEPPNENVILILAMASSSTFPMLCASECTFTTMSQWMVRFALDLTALSSSSAAMKSLDLATLHKPIFLL